MKHRAFKLLILITALLAAGGVSYLLGGLWLTLGLLRVPVLEPAGERA